MSLKDELGLLKSVPIVSMNPEITLILSSSHQRKASQETNCLHPMGLHRLTGGTTGPGQKSAALFWLFFLDRENVVLCTCAYSVLGVHNGHCNSGSLLDL